MKGMSLNLLVLAALTLLTACGGGGGGSSSGGSSSAYRLPYLTSSGGGTSLHLVNASTLAGSEQAVDEVGAYIPWQLAGDAGDAWRLAALPASHVFFYDSDGRGHRQALKGGGSVFAFPSGCVMSSWRFGDQTPAIPWAVAECGANGLTLFNLMATTGDGVVSEADLSGLNDIDLLAGVWDGNGPVGFIAAQRQSAGEYELYRYLSEDWAHPQRLGTASAAKGFRRLGLGDMFVRNQRVGARDTLWLEGDNGLAGKIWYQMSMGTLPLVLPVSDSVDLTGASQFRAQDKALYYTKTVGGVPAIYKLSGVSTETKLAEATVGSIGLWGFTPTRVIWQDGPNLRSSLLDGTGDTKTLLNSSSGSISHLYVRDETVFFSDGVFSSRILSNANAAQTLGVANLFRADFAGVNSGTAQDDGHLYLASTDGAGSVTVEAALVTAATDTTTLGSASGYTTATCTNDKLAMRVTPAPAPDGNLLLTLDCYLFVGDGGVFSFKSGQADSLTPLQPVAPHSTRTQTLLPLEPS